MCRDVGGGIVIYVNEHLIYRCFLVDRICDRVVVLKIKCDSSSCDNSFRKKDMQLFANYIPLINSTYNEKIILVYS